MKKKAVLILLTLVLSFCFGVISAFAADLGQQNIKEILIPSGDKLAMKEDVWAKLGSDGDYLNLQFKAGVIPTSSDRRLLSYDDSQGKIRFYLDNFTSATDKSRKSALSTFVSKMQSSRVSAQTQQTIIDDMSAANTDVSMLLIPLVMDSTKADLYSAMKVINPFLPVIRLIFGIGAFFIVMLLMGSTIIDLSYIGLPFAREWLDGSAERGGKKKPPFVTSDATSVVKETESSIDSSGGYKNAYLLYLKRRAFTYIILSICILYLVVGELGGLVAWLLKLASGTV